MNSEISIVQYFSNNPFVIQIPKGRYEKNKADMIKTIHFDEVILYKKATQCTDLDGIKQATLPLKFIEETDLIENNFSSDKNKTRLISVLFPDYEVENVGGVNFLNMAYCYSDSNNYQIPVNADSFNLAFRNWDDSIYTLSSGDIIFVRISISL